MSPVGPSQFRRWQTDLKFLWRTLSPRTHDSVVDLSVALSTATLPADADDKNRTWLHSILPAGLATAILSFGRNPRYSLQWVWAMSAFLIVVSQCSLTHSKADPIQDDPITFTNPTTNCQLLSQSMLISIVVSVPIVIDTVPALFVQSVNESIERDFVRLFALATITVPNVLMYSTALSPDVLALKQVFQFILLFELAIYYMYQLAATQKLPVYCSFFDITVDIQLICLLAFVYNLVTYKVFHGSHLIWFVVFSVGESGFQLFTPFLQIIAYRWTHGMNVCFLPVSVVASRSALFVQDQDLAGCFHQTESSG
jgi:hypothetical protein